MARAGRQGSETRGARETRETSERGRAMDTEGGSCKGSARANFTVLIIAATVTISCQSMYQLLVLGHFLC